MARKKKRSGRGRSQDRKLVASGQKHEVRYTAKKAGVKGKAIKKAVKRLGTSRKKVEGALKKVLRSIPGLG